MAQSTKEEFCAFEVSLSSPKAYSYIRFSSPEQAKGDSYRRQREAAEAYCQSNGLQLVGSKDYLFFDKGRSAYSGKHLDDTGELARFLSFVDNGTISRGSYLIVESLDRLSRERVKDALPRFLDLLNKGINVYTSADAKLYTSEYNELDLIISIVHMSRAHNESSIKGMRVSKAWKQKQAEARETGKPLGRACPYWIEYLEGKYHLIAERVEIIKMIFTLAQSGYGHRKIAKILNEKNVPIFGSVARNKSGSWGGSSCGKILSNRALLGEYQPTGLVNGVRAPIGEPVKNFFPAVISEMEFYAAQAARTARNLAKATKQSKNYNVWQGIAKCQLCDAAMHLVNKGLPPKGAKYLRCYGSSKGVCTGKQVRLDESESVFREILSKVDSLSLIQESQAKNTMEVSVLDARIFEVKARLAELQEQVLSLGAKLPASLVQVIINFESDVASYEERRQNLLADIRREKVVSKEDFFSKLDLVSYEGRAKANSLLKSLAITVRLHKEEFCTNYEVDGEFDRLFRLRAYSDGKINFWPYERHLLDLGLMQGDVDDLTHLFSEVIIKSEENSYSALKLVEFLKGLGADELAIYKSALAVTKH